MTSKLQPFLMFAGHAQEAMNLYLTAFPGSSIVETIPWKAGEAGKEGTLQRGVVRVCGVDIVCFDSPVPHAFTFTPATSLYVTCGSDVDIDAAFAKLADGGQVLMELDAYPFSKRYGWVNDRFGVSWQLTR